MPTIPQSFSALSSRQPLQHDSITPESPQLSHLPIPAPSPSSDENTSIPAFVGPSEPLTTLVDISSTLHQFPSRQNTPESSNTPLIPLLYTGLNAGPQAGTVVGATIGAVFGFIFLCWLIYVAINARGTGLIEGDAGTEDIVISRRSEHSSRRKQRRSRARSEVSESTRRSHSPRRRNERIIVQETVRRETSRAPPRSSHSVREEFVEARESERRVDGDDVVEVLEEHSSEQSSEPPPRRKSGYRTVDPNAYGGGNYAQRDIERDRIRSSRR